MTRSFENNYLGSAVKSARKYKTPELQGARINDFIGEFHREALQEISAFEGTKVLISCTPEVPLLPLVKRALSFADLVILSPAPLWFSCDFRTLPPYREFNTTMFASHISAGKPRACCPGALFKKLGSLFCGKHHRNVHNAVTFMPLISDVGHRWAKELFDIPHLPSGFGDCHTALELHREAMLSLCNERLVTETLGAAHLNALSFGRPVLNDLELARVSKDKWAHVLINVTLPALDSLPIAEILAVRRDLPDSFAAFSTAILREAKDMTLTGSDDAAVVLERRIAQAAEKLSSDLNEVVSDSSYLGHRVLTKTATFVLGTGGTFGEYSSAVAFLAGGGALWDLLDLIRKYRKVSLRARKDSMFFAAEILRRAEQRKKKNDFTLL